MILPFRLPPSHRPARGAALVIVLLLLTLLTVLLVLFSDVTRRESRIAALNEGSYQAETHARYGLHVAMSALQEALAPFDAPFAPAAVAPDRFWALAPGLIVHYPLEKTSAPYPAPIASYPLHSGAPFNEDGTALAQDAVVDLNRRLSSGQRPIDDTLPDGQTMAVAWLPILQDPSQPAGETNRLVGRYAFWIDDEGAKININTADGGAKYDGAKSYGPGTPSEVSLAALAPQALSPAVQGAIVARALEGGFTIPGEVAQVPGIPPALPLENRFFLTTYSRSPEFNLFNEPRIQLVPTNLNHLGLPQNDKNPIGGGNARSMFEGLFGPEGWMKAGNLLSQTPLRSVYPTPRQLSGPLQERWYVCPRLTPGGDTHRTDFAPLIPRTKSGYVWELYQHQSFEMGDLAVQIANYLNGLNARGEALEWPFPDGSYLGKYNQRQLDSITLQLLDLSRSSVPQGRGHYDGDRHKRDVNPALAPFGILQDKPVSGLGRAPRFTEFFIELSAQERLRASDGSLLGLELQSAFYLEMIYPMGSLHPNRLYEKGGYSNFGSHYHLGHFPVNQIMAEPSVPNSPDAPEQYQSGSFMAQKPSLVGLAAQPPVSSFWMDQFLIAKDQNGEPAGIDFWGNPHGMPDPDQPRAQANRLAPQDGGAYLGSGPLADVAAPMFAFDRAFDYVANHHQIAYPRNGLIPPGGYFVSRSKSHIHSYPTRDPVGGKEPVQSLTLSGGLCVWLQYFGIDDRGLVDFFPIESLKGTARGPGHRSRFGPEPPTLADLIVLPEVTLTPGEPAVIHGYVRDPWVNKNIGDWIISTNDAKLTMPLEAFTSDAYRAIYHTRPNADADDLAANWLTRDFNDPDLGWWANWAHQSSLPSIGVFHYIRTKMMPDDGSNAGVPFRCLSFAPRVEAAPSLGGLANSQAGIPDWALLDLFTIPQGLWRKPVSPHQSGMSMDWAFERFFGGDYELLTYGGATSGKINLNGAVLYPWAQSPTKAQRLPHRLKPLQAVFIGLKYNQDGKIMLDGERNVTNLQGPISQSEAEAIAQGVANVIEEEGPFFLPGRLCDVPEIAALGATVNATRNDVVAQTLGNLTTQGNVFSIWVASEAIRKARSNRQHDVLEEGDERLSSRRMRFVVERYLDLGVDQVPGNSADPGRDGVVGTFDDPVDPSYHPANPQFKYRILYAQEIL